MQPKQGSPERLKEQASNLMSSYVVLDAHVASHRRRSVAPPEVCSVAEPETALSKTHAALPAALFPHVCRPQVSQEWVRS